jgi:hypothetical protein
MKVILLVPDAFVIIVMFEHTNNVKVNKIMAFCLFYDALATTTLTY